MVFNQNEPFMLNRYHVVDVGHRIVGVGSVGMRAYLALLLGNDDNDPLFLQVKESTLPAHAPYVAPLPSLMANITACVWSLDSAPCRLQRYYAGRYPRRRASLLRAPDEKHEGIDSRGVSHRRGILLLCRGVRSIVVEGTCPRWRRCRHQRLLRRIHSARRSLGKLG